MEYGAAETLSSGMLLKTMLLYFSKCSGLFWVSRYLTRRGLRILCYHGFATADESRFRPSLFIDLETFRRRLAHLQKKQYPVLSLEAALDQLYRGKLPACATVITIDDGFFNVKKCGCEVLRKFSFPATLYMTTYYSIKETPVFRLVVQYMFWKTSLDFLNLSDLDCALSGKFSLMVNEERAVVTWKIIRFGEEQCDEQQRVALERRLGDLLGVDFNQIYKTRILSLMSPVEFQSLALDGVDIQLHTHRHRFPLEEQLATKEITDNKIVVEPVLGKRCQHFCYPSGVWSRKMWPWLISMGIDSAVTCEPGFNYPQTSNLALKRFLDGEHIPQIEFEAELSGFNELIRPIKSGVKALLALAKAES